MDDGRCCDAAAPMKMNRLPTPSEAVTANRDRDALKAKLDQAAALMGIETDAAWELVLAVERDARASGWRQVLAAALCQKGAIATHVTGRLHDGLQAWAEALPIARRVRDASLVLKALNGTAICHYRAGDYESALTRFNEMRAFALRQPKPSTKHVADALTGIGNVYYATERYAEAARWHREAINAMPEHETALGNLGLTLVAMGRYDEGLDCLYRGRDLCARRGESVKLSVAMGNVAHALHMAARMPEAEAAFRAAIAASRKAGVDVAMPTWLLGLGAVQAALGQWEDADLTLNSALVLARERTLPEAEREALEHLAQLEKARGRHEQALGAPAPAGTSARSSLSRRERVVLTQLVGGKTNPEIAAELGISRNTVRQYVSAVLRKLGVQTRSAAAAVGSKHL
jgi:DNA-binding CsgD family transcriptional regulator